MSNQSLKRPLRTAPVVRQPVSRQRVFGGEVVVPPGRSVVVSAPLAGTLKAGAVPVAGQPVKAGGPVLQLVPVLDPVGPMRLMSVSRPGSFAGLSRSMSRRS